MLGRVSSSVEGKRVRPSLPHSSRCLSEDCTQPFLHASPSRRRSKMRKSSPHRSKVVRTWARIQALSSWAHWTTPLLPQPPNHCPSLHYQSEDLLASDVSSIWLPPGTTAADNRSCSCLLPTVFCVSYARIAEPVPARLEFVAIRLG